MCVCVCVCRRGQILVGRAFQLLTAAKGSAINFTQVRHTRTHTHTHTLSLLHAFALLHAGLVDLLKHTPWTLTPGL